MLAPNKLLLFLFVSLALPLAIYGSTLTYVSVSCSPSIVGSTTSSLYLTTTIQSTIPVGGFVNVIVPIETSIKQGNLTCTLSGDITQSGLNCTAVNMTIRAKVKTQIASGSTIQINIMNAFTTPYSSAITSSFTLFTSLADGVTVLDSKSSGINLMVSPSTLTASSIQQTGSSVVGDSTTIQISITTTNLIPPNGNIILTFPVWNPTAPSSQQISMFESEAPNCTALQVLNATLACTLDPTQTILNVSGGIQTTVPKGTQIIFTVTQVLNPLSMASISVNIQTEAQNGGIIDTGSTSFSAQAPAQIQLSTVGVTADTTTIQSLSVFRMMFSNPVPLQAGTSVTVIFPQDFQVFSSLNQIEIYGLFGEQRYATYVLDQDQQSVKISDAVEQYMYSQISGKLVFQSLYNPPYMAPTQTFSIYLADSNGYSIAQITAGVTYTPTPGNITSISVTADKFLINQEPNIQIQFLPQHSIGVPALIKVQMPSNLIVSCSSTEVPNSGFSSAISCTNSSNNWFTFFTPFQGAYTPNTPLILLFSIVQNPGSAQPVTGLSIQTYQRVTLGQTNDYLVDNYTNSSLFFYQVMPAQFLVQSVVSSTARTYTDTTVTLSLTTGDAFPKGTYLVVNVPQQLVVVGSIQCAGVANMTKSPTCVYNSTANSVLVSNAFSTNLPAETVIAFNISTFRTPLTTQTTSTFQVYSYNSVGQMIDYVNNSLTLAMTQGMLIPTITASSSSNTVNGTTVIEIAFVSELPLLTGDQLKITIPNEIQPPVRSSLKCTGSGIVSTTLTCDIQGQILIVSLSLIKTSTIGQTISVSFQYCQNPDSTKASSQFSMQIYDTNDFLIAETSNNNTSSIQVGNAQTITDANLTALNPTQLATTGITISLRIATFTPQNAYIIVTYNPVYYVFNTLLGGNCSSTFAMNVSCKFLPNSQIQVSGLFQNSGFPSGTKIDVTINQVTLDSNVAQTMPTLTLVSMTPDGYLIDQVTQGLTLTFLCDVPCATCLANNVNFCLTCNPFTTSTILYENKCISQCPSGMYLNTNTQTCLACDSKCLTCTVNNPSQCITCDSKSQYPYLDGTTCTAVCSSGSVPNNQTWNCDACKSPCITCSGSTTSCVTCNQTLFNKFQYNGNCVSNCPSGTTSVTNVETNQCLNCSTNCKQCSANITTCTSCPSSLILSKMDDTCVSTCPFGSTVYNSSTDTCNVCGTSCQTCQGSPNFCTSCASGLNLLQTAGQCVGQCSTNNTLVGFNGLCTSCNSQCLTCVNSPESCLSCNAQNGSHLYNYTCLSTCPTGYDVNSDNQCVISGLICPFGQKVNALGNACELVVQICNPGFELNYARDRCIPVPGKYAPFPLCIICILLSGLVVGSWIKFKQTLVATNIIAAMSVVETLGIFIQIILAYQMGVYSTFALSLVAFLFLYGSNLFFTLVFLKQIQHDSAFKYWLLAYPQTKKIVLIIGTAFNFKFYRVIYGRFFGKEIFNASFDEPQHFFRPFTFISIFSLLTTMVPILVANIIGLVFVQFGYQLQMFCIELTIIELVMLALIIYEKIKMRKIVLKQHQYYKVNPKHLDQTNVMSSLIDEKPQSGSSVYTMKTSDGLLANTQYSKPTPKHVQEYYERRRGLEKLISKLGSANNKVVNHRDTTIGIIEKLQDDEIMKRLNRNCRSFKDLRDHDEDFVDQGAADPELQNFISAPTSPREKELLHNPFFLGKVGEFKKACRQRDQFDNVYAEGKPAHYFPMRTCNLISIKVQTNLLELLAVDDLPRQVQTKQIKKSLAELGNELDESEEFVEENLEEDYAQDLIEGVIDGFKEHEFRKQRRRLDKERMAQIPNFDLEDIMGDFDLDDTGNLIMIRGRDGRMVDREGRKVNKRGYLIDPDGNVISDREVLIFKNYELDSDEEIPAPFCFEKKKESLFKVEGIQEYQGKMMKKEVMQEEDEIEREYRRIREKNKSNRSSVESLMGETPSKYTKKNARKVISIPGDEDGFLSKIVQPMEAKSKNELLKKGNKSVQQSQQNANGTRGSTTRNLAQTGRIGFDVESNNTQETASKNRTNYIHGVNQSFHNQNNQSLTDYNTSIDRTVDQTDNFFLGGGRSRAQAQSIGNNAFTTLFNTRGAAKFAESTQNEDLAMLINQERIQKLSQLKETLGTSREDQMLKKQLAKFENSLLGRNQVEPQRNTTLAKKNLQKVYGKVREKMTTIMDFHQPRDRKVLNQSYLDDEAEFLKDRKQQKNQFQRDNALPDSRMKNLENIYIRGVNTDKRAASQLLKHRSRQHQQHTKQQQSSWDIIDQGFSSGLSQHRHMQHSLVDTGLDTGSDHDEQRVRQQLDKMNKIIEKGSKSNQQKQTRSTKKIAGNASIMKGGWI